VEQEMTGLAEVSRGSWHLQRDHPLGRGVRLLLVFDGTRDVLRVLFVLNSIAVSRPQGQDAPLFTNGLLLLTSVL
jgi:hypothetical protein